jgi:hypothetical protein
MPPPLSASEGEGVSSYKLAVMKEESIKPKARPAWGRAETRPLFRS